MPPLRGTPSEFRHTNCVEKQELSYRKQIVRQLRT